MKQKNKLANSYLAQSLERIIRERQIKSPLGYIKESDLDGVGFEQSKKLLTKGILSYSLLLGSSVSFYVESRVAKNKFNAEIEEKPQDTVQNFQYSASDLPVSGGLFLACSLFAVKGLYHAIKTFKIIKKKQLYDSFKKFKYS
ncbi:MAG: hypothetical protein ACMXX6_02035 [Candidatus Woesearchaeota archaeon]